MQQKVDVTDLKIGMYVTELDRPWLETPFLFQGFPIRSQEEIDTLREYCAHVYIDVEQSQAVPPPRQRTTPPAANRPDDHRFETRRLNIAASDRPERHARNTVPFRREFREAAYTWSHAHHYIKGVLEDVRLGGSVDSEATRHTTDRMAKSIVRNENALVWLTQLKHHDEYTSQHSLNVCILALLFGRHLGLETRQLKELGFGALMHDIGKMRVPLEVLNKPGPLTDEEDALLKAHPAQGYEILRRNPGFTPSALDIAYSHHERVDGSGYPRGLSGRQISRFAKIVSVVDVYDAITSDRAYHMGISPHEALGMMYGWAMASFEAELLEEFIRCLGIFPVGSIVELDTGEVGVVMTVNREHRLRPLLTLVLDADKRPLPAYKLLSLEAMAKAGTPLHVRKILRSNAYGIDVRQVILHGQHAEDLVASAG